MTAQKGILATATTLTIAATIAAASPFEAEADNRSRTEVNTMTTTLNTTWDKTFPLSEKVIHEKVSYPNRYGITIAADMYKPADFDGSGSYAALIVGTPYGGVKEQGAGIYAQAMAERGFIAIAFDESYNGESGGTPRRVSSPDIFVEDFSAGVDFLGTRPFVDRERIGVIGICGSGAFALTAAQVDPRIKAVATASMYDMSHMIRKGWMDSMTDAQRAQNLRQLAYQRWEDFEAGTPALTPAFPNEPAGSIPPGLDPITSEFFEYYAMQRGHHPRAIAAFTQVSSMAFTNFRLNSDLASISPRPILFIMGENAHSRYFTEDAYELAAEPKELYVVPGARHIDLYDRLDMIPFDKLEAFFSRYLAANRGMAISRAESRGEMDGPADWFSGEVKIEMLATTELPSRLGAANVSFSAGARTAWHTHPLGQTLIITEGTGWVQREGGPIEIVRPGDVVRFAPQEKHWHGASATEAMSHIAIQEALDGKAVDWLEHVTDEQYLRN